jgi:hypothetical protein
MKGLTAYHTHLALNLHFSDTPYDCVKYGFKTRGGEESFKKNRYRWQYIGLENKVEDLRYCMFKVFEQNDFKYVSAVQLFKQARSYYNDTPRLFIETQFIADLKSLSQKYDDKTNLFALNDLYPNIYHEYKDACISFETFLILNAFIKDVIHNDSRDIIAWPSFVSKCDSVLPMIQLFHDRRKIEHAFATNYLQVV